MMNAGTNAAGEILIQVVDVKPGRQVGLGPPVAEELTKRLDDIRQGIAAGIHAVAQSLDQPPEAHGWQLGEVSAKFGLTLGAQTGVIVASGSAAATFEVTVTFSRGTTG